MKLILINLYPVETIAGYLLSSYVLKAYLDKFFENDKNISIEVLNFNADVEPLKISEEIIKHHPNWIGYSCYIWNIEKILDIIKNLKDISNYIHILGGPEISLNMIQKRKDLALADYYVIGEGERSLANLLSHLKNKSFGDKIQLGKIITNLDQIPSIYLNGVIEDDLYIGQQAFLETQRGCRYKCRYCVYHKNLPSIHYYSLERVLSELDYLIIKKQIRALRIFDAVFTSDLPRAKKIVRHLIKIREDYGLSLPWIYWEFNYYDVDEEFIKLVASLKSREKILNSKEILPTDRPQLYSALLKDYTAINCVGVQSFSKEALRAVGRVSINFEALKDFMRKAKENNVVLKTDLILGLPFETFNSYFEGLEFFLPFFKDTDHILNIHLLQILPGSDLEKLSDNYGIKYSLKAPHLVFSTQSFSEKEMKYALKLSAILFRILNSPLRKYFFEAKEATGKSFYELTKNIFDKISALPEFKKSQLYQSEYVDDVYWNGNIFKEIPSACLVSLLKK